MNTGQINDKKKKKLREQQRDKHQPDIEEVTMIEVVEAVLNTKIVAEEGSKIGEVVDAHSIVEVEEE